MSGFKKFVKKERGERFIDGVLSVLKKVINEPLYIFSIFFVIALIKVCAFNNSKSYDTTILEINKTKREYVNSDDIYFFMNVYSKELNKKIKIDLNKIQYVEYVTMYRKGFHKYEMTDYDTLVIICVIYVILYGVGMLIYILDRK